MRMPLPQMPVPQNRPQQTPPGIDPQAFINYLPQLNGNMLEQLIQQARSQGISEQQIQEGLAVMKRLRNNRG